MCWLGGLRFLCNDKFRLYSCTRVHTTYDDRERQALHACAVRLPWRTSRGHASVRTEPASIAVLDGGPDNRILECAVTEQTHVIVTGDRTMLSLKKYQEIRILSLRQCLDEISFPDP